ncbi:MAG: LysR family transcriptional regulator [Sheuella sp.]|nr:LysR family transcriptional regulator [Sheuella sp.]
MTLPPAHSPSESTILSFRIELVDIETFIAIVELESFSHAALRMHVSQPTVTARLQRLEDRLGTKLLTRTTRKLAPTKEGLRLYQEAVSALHGLHQLVKEFDSTTNRGGHRIMIGATPMIAATMMPSIFHGYKKRYPDVQIQLFDLQYQEIIEKILSGEADLGVVAFDGDSTKLRFQHLAEEELLLVVPVDHPLAEFKEVVLKKVLKYPLLILDRYKTLISLIKEEGNKRNLPIKSLSEATQLTTLLAMLDAGNGITLLPSSMAQTNAKLKRPTLRVTDVSLTRQYGVVVAKKNQPSSATQSFIDFLHQEYAKTLAAKSSANHKQ